VETTYANLRQGKPIIGWGGLRQLLQGDTDRLCTLMTPTPQIADKFGSETYSGRILAHMLRERGALRAQTRLDGLGWAPMGLRCQREMGA
jgi:hypothetical protein